MLVLEDHCQGDVLRGIVRRRWLRNRDRQILVAPDLGRRVADRVTGRFHRAAPDQGFQAFARERRHGRGERAVKAPTGMGGVQANVDRLKTPHENNMGRNGRGSIPHPCLRLNSGPFSAE